MVNASKIVETYVHLQHKDRVDVAWVGRHLSLTTEKSVHLSDLLRLSRKSALNAKVDDELDAQN